MTEVRFPDGTIVRGSSLFERYKNTEWTQYGLYLDPRWEPESPSDFITWPDYGLPTNGVEAAETIRLAFDAARSGTNVEIGCAGGVGRTGTVIACMAILAGVARDEAVNWVRRNYHPHAVETDEQERWVMEFGQSKL